MEQILEIKSLTKYYGKILGVKDLSLSLNEGEIFGFIGPNGAGKSTTIRSIMNLINKTEGKVIFLGQELIKDNIGLKKLIGYLPSEIHLYGDFTVGETLDYHEKFYENNIHKKRVRLVKKLQLDESKKVEDLSLGNLKKVGIILAFMHSPKLLILDEATSGLDPIMQQAFYELLLEEKRQGTTIFYSTHILSEIGKVCDRVGIIKDGKLLKIEVVNSLKHDNLNFITLKSSEVNKLIKEMKLNILSREDDTIYFKNTLTSNQLIKRLAKYNIDRLLIKEATLEEMFMHYYK